MASRSSFSSLVSKTKETFQHGVSRVRRVLCAVGRIILKLFGWEKKVQNVVNQVHSSANEENQKQADFDRNNNSILSTTLQGEKKRISPTRKFRGEVSALTGKKYSPSGKEILKPDDVFMADIYSNLKEEDEINCLEEVEPIAVLFTGAV